MTKWVLLVVTCGFSASVYSNDLLKTLQQSQLMENLAPELRVLLTLTSLSFIPIFMIAMTSFTRIVIVLSLLRQALGLMQTPPNVVILTLAFFLTWFTMSPVYNDAKDQALVPYLNEEIAMGTAIARGVSPFREFMISQTRQEDFAAVLNMVKAKVPARAQDVELQHLVPAFMLSELRIAFQIAFVIFIPFLLVDLIVASTLMALGMIMVPPITIALPIKIMLFVLIDGWTLVTQSLVGSFHS